MGCCTGRCFLITLCVLQMISIIERQVFDFLGYMWAPIIGNFLQIIFVIIGFFGAYQYRPKVVVAYTVWCMIWIGWNIFVICFYLEVGILSRDSPILNIGTGNKSWWFNNGIGCKTNSTWEANNTPTHATELSRPVPDEWAIYGCLLQYYYVEIIHAGVQCLLSLLGFCVASYVIYVFTEEDDSSQPVHDELEYIKMRYRSPARSSFRDNKTYETLTTRSTYSTVTGGGVDHTNYHSDDSVDHGGGDTGDKHHQQQQQLQQQLQQHKKNKTYVFNGGGGEMLPPQTEISAPVPITGDVPWVNAPRAPGGGGGDYGFSTDLGTGDQPQNQFTFSIVGSPPGATVI